MIGADKSWIKFAATADTRRELEDIQRATGERTSSLIRRLIHQEAMLVHAGFTTGPQKQQTISRKS